LPSVTFTRQPTVRTQYAPRAVAPADTSAAQGLAGLGQVLSGFFGAQANIQQKYDQLEHNRQLEEIQLANQDQKVKAIADVERGQDIDPALAGDRDYADTYTSAIATKHATESANKFKTEVLSKLGPDADFDTAFRTFTAEETKNGARTGTGNDLYDATFLKTLKGQTDNFKASHEANVVKFQQAKAIDAHQSMVTAAIPNLNPVEFNKLLQGRQAVMPWAQASEVQASVWSDALSAAKRPEDINRLSVAMEDPAFGDGKRSFRDMYPDASDKLQKQMLGKYQSDIDIRGQQAWDAMDQKLDQATQTGDVDALNTIMHNELPALFQQHGGNARLQTMRNGLQTALNKAMTTDTQANSYAAMLSGKAPLDISNARKFQEDFFKKSKIDPMTNPVQAAFVISKMGVINDNLKHVMSTAMNNTASPQGFSSAFQFYAAIENSGPNGPALVSSMLDGKSMVAYDYAKREFDYNKTDPALSSVQFAEIAKEMKGKDRPKAFELLHEETPGKGDAKLRSIIDEELDGAAVNGAARTDLENATMDYMIANKSNAEDAAKQAVKRMVPNMQMYPGVDGKMELSRPTVKGAVKFGESVLNPLTQKPENTIKTYQNDVDNLAGAFVSHPHLRGRGTDDFSLDANSAYAGEGLYLVKAGGQQVRFGFGQSYQIATPGATFEAAKKPTTITIPQNRKEAEEMLATTPLIDHDRFVLKFRDDDILLAYKPGYTGRIKTREEQEAAYKQPVKRTSSPLGKALEKGAGVVGSGIAKAADVAGDVLGFIPKTISRAYDIGKE